VPANVVIVGGGVSGLATAYFLGKLGIPSLLIEKSRRLGGLIQTERVKGCVLEAGPDSYLAAKPQVTELASEIPALEGQGIGSNDAARRIFVVRSRQLVAMPPGMVLMVPAKLGAALGSRLFSASTKLRLAREMLLRPRRRGGDVSVGEFIRDHFGRELLEYVAEPLLQGVYGGDSGDLSARSVLPRFVAYEEEYGSLIRGVRKEQRKGRSGGSLFLSFREGMQSLTDALGDVASEYTRVLHTEVTRVERSGGGWRIHGDRQVLAEATDVVLACPAHVGASLLETATPRLAGELARIPYSSAILVTLVYDCSKLTHPLNGFGFLVPRAERRTIAAATWVSTKFPSRVAPNLAALRAFIVAGEARQLMAAPETDLVEMVRADFKDFMGIDVRPEVSMVHKWPRSMPQYVVGHEERLRMIHSAAAELRGLYLVGNAYQGVGIPDCVRLAKETAKSLVVRVRAQSLAT
jgi:oxygen-dependent protoporphyrinogen oxidase